MRNIKSHISIILVFVRVAAVLGQVTYVQKDVVIPGAINGYSRGIAELDANTFFLVGTTYQQVGTELHNKLTIACVDGAGGYNWSKSYGNNRFNYLPLIGSWQMLLKSNNSFYSVLSAVDSSGKQAGIFVKFDLNGDTVWQRKHYGNIGQDISYYALAPSFDNGFLILGTVQTNTPTYNNHPTVGLNIRKTDAFGNKLWDKVFYADDLDFVEVGISILQDSVTGNIFVGGYEAGSPKGFGVVWILDSLGNLKNKIGSLAFPFYSNISKIIKTQSGDFIASGTWASDQTLYTDYYKSFSTIVKFDSDGNIIFRKTYDTLDVFNGTSSIVELPNGNLIVSGTIDNLMNHEHSYNGMTRIMELDKDGNLLWKKYFDHVTNPDNIDAPYGLLLTSDYKIAFTTATYEARFEPVYFTFYKTDTNYCAPDAVGCYATSISNWILEDLKIKISPNPSRGFLIVDGLSYDGALKIQIQNSLGEIALEQSISPEENKIDLNIFENGIYFVCILNSGISVYSSKIVISK